MGPTYSPRRRELPITVMRLLYSAGAPASGCPKNGHESEYEARTGAVQRGPSLGGQGESRWVGRAPGEVVALGSVPEERSPGCANSLLACYSVSITVAHVAARRMRPGPAGDGPGRASQGLDRFA